MSGSTGSASSGEPRPGRWARFRRVMGRAPAIDLSDEHIAQGLSRLSLRYADEFRAHETIVDGRKAADALLQDEMKLIDRLPRWWMAETTAAFTSVAVDEFVYASEPGEWPPELWPRAHQLWVAANEVGILAKRYLGPGRRFYVSYQAVAVQAELLAFLDRVNRRMPVAFDEEGKRLERLLAQARLDFQRSAVTPARVWYLVGVGLAIAAISPVSLALLILQASGPSVDPLFTNAIAAAIAGASGALVSVLTRITNETLRVDYHVGPRMLVLLGIARPVVGAILALALYWATVARIVPLAPPVDGPDIRFAFYIAIGFLAGFSERYAQDMLLVRSTAEQPGQTAAAGAGAGAGGSASRGTGGTGTTGSGEEPADQPATA